MLRPKGAPFVRIVRLEIERFRCVRNAVLDPDKDNVYPGPNNVGKTAFARVRAWEANRRTPDGPALVLLHIAARQPQLIVSVRQDAGFVRPRQSRSPA
jgi:hypothetical protein